MVAWEHFKAPLARTPPCPVKRRTSDGRRRDDASVCSGVVQAAQPGIGDHPSLAGRFDCTRARGCRPGRDGSGVVVVIEVAGQDARRWASSKHDQVVQTLPPDRADQPFDVGASIHWRRTLSARPKALSELRSIRSLIPPRSSFRRYTDRASSTNRGPKSPSRSQRRSSSSTSHRASLTAFNAAASRPASTDPFSAASPAPRNAASSARTCARFAGRSSARP